MKKRETSWEGVAKWYDKSVGKEGHYYHKKIVLPGVLRLLNLNPNDTLLDLGCGQGVLAHQIPRGIAYVGIDASKSLIAAAKKAAPKEATFFVADVTQPLDLQAKEFSKACIILALQNMKEPRGVFANLARHLKKGGRCVVILNHPCYRIPRQSSWGIDEAKHLQYRRVDRYMSPLSIPIEMHPGQKSAEKTLSFHFPLSYYVTELCSAGFVITAMEEWCSDKKSTGAKAKMENRARQEFPLFLALTIQRR